jgi:signal transduction histidine kinase
MLESLNVSKQCQKYGVRLWQCPQFLFLLMGVIIIISILTTNFVAKRFVDPEIVALIVLGLTAVLFIIGHVIIAGFERVAESSQAKSEFVSIMSRELRSPLSAIKWQLNLIKRTRPEKEELDPMLAVLEEKNEEMMKIANKLLLINQIEGDGLILRPLQFSLKKLVKDVIAGQQSFAKFSHVSVVLKAPDGPLFVFADEIRIKDVLNNIIDNAIRYSFKEWEALVMLEKMPGFVKCSVVDKGIGISPEDSKKIFTKFFRSENIVRYQTKGVGAGLYISKAIVEASGGKIGFESVEGRGSTFWFTLPIDKSEA